MSLPAYARPKASVAIWATMEMVFTAVITGAVYSMFALKEWPISYPFLIITAALVMKGLLWFVPIVFVVKPLSHWLDGGGDVAEALRASNRLLGPFMWWWIFVWVAGLGVLIQGLSMLGAAVDLLPASFLMSSIALGAGLQINNMAQANHAPLRERIHAALAASGTEPSFRPQSIRTRLIVFGMLLVVIPILWITSLVLTRGTGLSAAMLLGFTLPLVLWGGVTSAMTGILLARPLERLSNQVGKIVATGDLTIPLAVYDGSESGRMASTFRTFVAGQRELVGDSQGLLEQVQVVVGKLVDTTADVREGAECSQALVGQTTADVAKLLNALEVIADSGVQLVSNSEQSASTVVELNQSATQMREAMGNLTRASDSAASAVDEMRASFMETASTIVQLEQRTSQTATAMADLDTLSQQIGARAAGAAAAADQVERQAATGIEALRDTVATIQGVVESTRQAATSNQILGRSIAQVRGILQVIDALAKQTNLLSLNAAIIASQAGTQGAGFTVVAEEIKQLALRTGSSTSEIAGIIAAVEREAGLATSALEASVAEAESGMERVNQTEGQLGDIVTAIGDALQQVEGIVSHSHDQNQRSQEVNQATQDITRSLAELNRAASQQAQSTDIILRSSTEVYEQSRQVGKAGDVQAAGMAQIAQAAEQARSLAANLSSAQKQETARCQSLAEAAEQISAIANIQTTVIRDLDKRVDALDSQARALSERLARYTV